MNFTCLLFAESVALGVVDPNLSWNDERLRTAPLKQPGDTGRLVCAMQVRQLVINCAQFLTGGSRLPSDNRGEGTLNTR